MSGLLFVPQAQLDEWLESGAADLTADGLQPLPKGELLPVESAFRFMEVLDGEDRLGLVGRVKSEEKLRGLGAEPYGDSVLLGEVVYRVVPGFLARTPAPSQSGLQPGRRALDEAGGTSGRGTVAAEEEEGAERLAEFFSPEIVSPSGR